MNLSVLVRRNILDPVRTRSLWVLLALFVLVFGLVGYLLGPNQFTSMPNLTATIMGVLAPLAALVYSYESIAGPRQSGSLRVLLTYPYSRRQVVLGTLIGRVTIVLLAIVTGIVAAVLATALAGGSIDIVSFALVLAASLLFTAVIVAVGIGISASVATTNRAAMLAFGFYLLFFAFWGQLPTVVRFVLNGFSFPTGRPPEWVAIWNQLNPFTAFNSVIQGLLTETASSAFYEALWFGVLVLLGWFVVSVIVGLIRFERADL